MKSYLLGSVFLGLLLLLVVYKGFLFMRRGVVMGQYKTNLVLVVGDQVSWVNWDSGSKQMIVFRVPENMMIPVVGMQGDLKAKVLWKFAQDEGKAVTITKRSLELMFGGVADGVVFLPQTKPTEAIDDIREALWSWKSQSDLGWGRRVLLGWQMKDLRNSQVKVVVIPETLGVVEKLADGSEVVSLDRQRLDMVVVDNLNEDKIMEGTARISIVNASGVVGMAKLMERQLKAVGGLVVEVKEDDVVEGGCHWSANQKTVKENAGLVGWLNYKLNCAKETIQNELADGEVYLLIGRNWGEAYSR